MGKVGITYLLLSATGFGLMPLFANYAYSAGANVASLLSVRFILAAIIFWLLFYRQAIQLKGKQVLSIMVIGAIGYGGVSAFYFSALLYISASLTALIFYLYPILVALVSYLLKIESPNKKSMISLVVSFMGLVLVIGTAKIDLNLFGIFLAFGGAAFYAGYILLCNRLISSISPAVTSLYVTSGMAVAYLIAVLSGGWMTWNMGKIAWMNILLLALVSTLMAVLLFLNGLKQVGPTKAAITSNFEPVVSVLVGMLFLGDQLNIFQLFGGGLILIGIIFVSMASKQTLIEIPQSEVYGRNKRI